jgi:CHRD domain
MQILIFRSPDRIRNIAENAASLFLGACLLGAYPATTIQVRLSPGPRLVGTREARSGCGSVNATLEGNILKLHGSFQGLLGLPTVAQLHFGSLPGVRGPAFSSLTITPAANGEISGQVQLSSEQLAAFHKGGIYIEIDSDRAPEGDLWGWILPQ